MPGIVVVGSYNQDTVLRVPRFPQPGETLAASRLDRFHGGKGSNQAVAAARSGARVAMVAAVGADVAGDAALALWREEGIAADGVARMPGLPTGEALILVEDGGENEIVIVAGANAAVAPDQAAAAVKAGAALVLAQLETPLAATEAAFRAARAAGATTLLNAAPARALPAGLLDLTDILAVNETEAAMLAGQDAPADQVAALLSERHRRGVVLTAGAAGAYWAGRAGSVVHVPAPRVTVVDSTGAGDAFLGAFAAALVGGAGDQAALRRGVAAGALACGQEGAVPSLPRLAEILAASAGQ